MEQDPPRRVCRVMCLIGFQTIATFDFFRIIRGNLTSGTMTTIVNYRQRGISAFPSLSAANSLKMLACLPHLQIAQKKPGYLAIARLS